MKNTSFVASFVAFFVLMLLAATPLLAQKYEAMKAEDLLRDVMVYQRPEDFATAQQLAYQSRAERIERINEIIKCIDLAANMDDIESCQVKETDALAKIRLSYCNTNVSWPDRKKMQGEAARGFQVDATECEKVMSGLTGKPMRKKNKGQGQEDVEVISEEMGGEAEASQPAPDAEAQ